MKRIALVFALFFVVALIFPADAPAPEDPCIGVVCDDPNLCIEGTCNPSTGLCEYETVIVCDDTDLCKTGVCNPDTGECEYRIKIVRMAIFVLKTPATRIQDNMLIKKRIVVMTINVPKITVMRILENV